MLSGWKKSRKDRYALDGKVIVAGFSNAKDFHDYREAAIAEKYDTDEIILRIIVKILAKKYRGRLGRVAGKLKKPVFERKCAEYLFTEVMSAAKVREREGHGYEYPVRGSIVNLGSPVRGAGYLMPAPAGGVPTFT